MKHSTWMNFCKIANGLLIAIALLATVTIQSAMAQEEPAATTDPAAAETATEEAVAPAPPPPATTLERIRANGTIRFGYRTDARPFSYKHESGVAAGFSVALCGKVADAVQGHLGLSSLNVEWVEVGLDDRFIDVQDGKVDLLCGADTANLSRRQNVSFSQPIFPGGIGAVVRADAPTRLQLVLEGKPLPNQPMWRGYPAQVLQHKRFSAVASSTAESWLTGRINQLGILATAVPVDSYETGIAGVVGRDSDALFGDRAILLDAVARSEAADDLKVLDRLFTVEPIALTLARGDEDFRLVVDRALSNTYASSDFGQLYADSFGEPGERALLFYLMNTLPQ